MKLEHFTWNPDINSFDVDREAIIKKYGIGENFSAGNVILYEFGKLTIHQLRHRSSFPRYAPENYGYDSHQWVLDVNKCFEEMTKDE